MIVEPELLILDDALSAVDAKTEEAILSNLKRNAPRKTTIITAHRLSSVMHAKEILVLDEGKIIERGRIRSYWLRRVGISGCGKNSN